MHVRYASVDLFPTVAYIFMAMSRNSPSSMIPSTQTATLPTLTSATRAPAEGLPPAVAKYYCGFSVVARVTSRRLFLSLSEPHPRRLGSPAPRRFGGELEPIQATPDGSSVAGSRVEIEEMAARSRPLAPFSTRLARIPTVQITQQGR